MLQMGFFEVVYNEGHRTVVSAAGEDVLYGRRQTELCVIDHSVKETPKRRTPRLTLEIPIIAAQGLPSANGPEDPELFEALRQLRRQCAEEEGFPPYIVFSDKVLHTLAARKPTSIEQFGFIPGVGDHKRQKYGQRFTALIQKFVRKEE